MNTTYCKHVLVFWVALVSILSSPAFGNEKKDLLLLHSSHQGLAWTANITKGIQSVYGEYKYFMWDILFIFSLLLAIIVVLCINILRRKRAEEALRESEARYRELFNNMSSGVAVYEVKDNGRDFIFKDFNKAGERIDGDRKEDLIGKSIFEMRPGVEKFGLIDVFQKVWETGEPMHHPIRLYEDERLSGWYENFVYKLPSGEIIAVFDNITARKQAEEALRESEEKLKTLFGAMTEMVVLHELAYNDRGEAVDYRITDCNHAFTAVMGIKHEDAVGKLATEVYQTESAPYLKEYSRVVFTGEPYEFTAYYPPMDKHFMISAVSLQKGQFATISTDISAIKEIQEVISAKNKELENYLFVASHDLRSPLVNIQGFSQRLQKQTDLIKELFSEYPLEPDIQQEIEHITDEGIPKSLDFILINVSKMDTLINGLLKISRTGRVKMSIQQINMNNLMERVIRALSFQIEEARGKVVIEDLSDCYGDAALLDQLFSNIISNSLKYKDKARQLVIRIAAQISYNKVMYSIRDTGIGIAPRHLEKIWDVFYQVDSQSPDSGEGIGLSIVKRIVDKHKGKIWVESQESKGSVFFIELPGYEFSE